MKRTSFYTCFMSVSVCMYTLSAEIVHNLSLDEKIGQLFMVATHVDGDAINKPSVYSEDIVMSLIQNYHIGGIILLGRSNLQQYYEMMQRITQYNDALSDIPLLIGLDAEWGAAMRLDGMIKFPFNLTLGAVADNDLIYQMGYEVGRQLKLLGVDINFAPVVDINTNPNNPVINRRSFGENPLLVASKSQAYMTGLQNAGILACAKHFPGHGDTAIDSHFSLPIITHDIQRLEDLELCPFKRLIDVGVDAVMIGHLMVPSLDMQWPATLSKKIISWLLKEYLHFSGLIFTDALDMKGITLVSESGQAELRALQAGADILLVPVDVPKAHACIKSAVLEGIITLQELDEHVTKIVEAKKHISSKDRMPRSYADIEKELNTQQARYLAQKLYNNAITLAWDNDSLIPILSNSSLCIITTGSGDLSPFITQLNDCTNATTVYLSPTDGLVDIGYIHQVATAADIIIIGIAGISYTDTCTYGIVSPVRSLLDQLLLEGKRVIVVLFGNPYALKLFRHAPAAICAYEDHVYAQQAAAAVILGRDKALGVLPITVAD